MSTGTPAVSAGVAACGGGCAASRSGSKNATSDNYAADLGWSEAPAAVASQPDS